MKDLLKAGKISSIVREIGKKDIREGKNIYAYVKSLEDKIRELGANTAFPINISINEDAAHDTADYESSEVFKEGQLVKVDIGAEVNGFVGDTAFTAEIKTRKYSELIKASEKALNEALKIIKPGVKLCDVGKVIEETIKSFGYVPIKNLGGHGVAKYNLHTGVFIPNYNNNNTNILKEDDTIAVEPFATNGKGTVINKNLVKIYSLENAKPTRLPSARKIQNFAKKYNGLPFAEHQLLSNNIVSALELKMGIRELVKNRALHSYNVLTELGKGMVSQAEHTLIVKEEPIITTL